MDTFLENGPFQIDVKRDYEIRVSDTELVVTDLYLAKHRDPAPLIIIQHGNLGDKSVHRNQAMRLASWGIHCLVLSLPNKGSWIQNGHTVARLTTLLHDWPALLGNRFDPNNIVIAGHSFGGSAVAIAAGLDAPIRGAIFLDPALFDDKIRDYIKKIDIPSILIGADRSVFQSKRRRDFYKLIKQDILEVSVRDSTHNDAQSPNLFSINQFLHLEHPTSLINQDRFTAALIASAFSLGATGSNLFAWESFQPEIARGNLINAKRK